MIFLVLDESDATIIRILASATCRILRALAGKVRDFRLKNSTN
jgi:hypothetical protein